MTLANFFAAKGFAKSGIGNLPSDILAHFTRW
jgi:hypothetical protein